MERGSYVQRSFRAGARRGRIASGAVQLRERYLRPGDDPHARALLSRLECVRGTAEAPPPVVVLGSESVLTYAALFDAAPAPLGARLRSSGGMLLLQSAVRGARRRGNLLGGGLAGRAAEHIESMLSGGTRGDRASARAAQYLADDCFAPTRALACTLALAVAAAAAAATTGGGGGRTEGAPPPPAATAPGWVCGSCTLHNPAAYLACDACGATAPREMPSSGAAAVAAVGASELQAMDAAGQEAVCAAAAALWLAREVHNATVGDGGSGNSCSSSNGTGAPVLLLMEEPLPPSVLEVLRGSVHVCTCRAFLSSLREAGTASDSGVAAGDGSSSEGGGDDGGGGGGPEALQLRALHEQRRALRERVAERQRLWRYARDGAAGDDEAGGSAQPSATATAHISRLRSAGLIDAEGEIRAAPHLSAAIVSARMRPGGSPTTSQPLLLQGGLEVSRYARDEAFAAVRIPFHSAVRGELGIGSGALADGFVAGMRSLLQAEYGRVVEQPGGGGGGLQLASVRVMVLGRGARNRAVHGDTVALEMLPVEMWRAPGGRKRLVPGQDSAAAAATTAAAVGSEPPVPCARVVAVSQPGRRTFVATLAPPRRDAAIEAAAAMLQERTGRGVGEDGGSATTSAGAEQVVLAVPMDPRLPLLRLRTRQGANLLGQRLVVSLDNWRVDADIPDGHYVRVLGPTCSLEAEITALMLEEDACDATEPFSRAALACLPPRRPPPSDGAVSLDEAGSAMPRAEPHEVADRLDLRPIHATVRATSLPPSCFAPGERLVFSVDPPGCQDIDDAMSVRLLPDGSGDFELGVHIADVTHFLKRGSALDAAAAARGTTVYLVDRRFDMLPSLLSADLCSLRQGVERLAVSVLWRVRLEPRVSKARDGAGEDAAAAERLVMVGADGASGASTGENDGSVWFGRTVIRSAAAMTYGQADRLIDGKQADSAAAKRAFTAAEAAGRPAHPPGQAGAPVAKAVQPALREALGLLTRVARAQRGSRQQAGSVELAGGSELKFTVKKAGAVANNDMPDVTAAAPKEDLEIHSTVAELMIMANAAVARATAAAFPGSALLRRHENPSADRLGAVQSCAAALAAADKASATSTLKAGDRNWFDASNGSALAVSLEHGREMAKQHQASTAATAATTSNASSTPAAAALLVSLTTRAMAEAKYMSSGDSKRRGDSADAAGGGGFQRHFGLGLEYYTHFTSPIRRYADVVVHRTLLAAVAVQRSTRRSEVAGVHARERELRRLGAMGIAKPGSAAAALPLPLSLAPSMVDVAKGQRRARRELDAAARGAQPFAMGDSGGHQEKFDCGGDDDDNNGGADENLTVDNMLPSADTQSAAPADAGSAVAELCTHLNVRTRMAKMASRRAEELFLALFVLNRQFRYTPPPAAVPSPEVVAALGTGMAPERAVEAVVVSLRENGFIAYVPRFDIKSPVYLRDREGCVQAPPTLLRLGSGAEAELGPATGAFRLVPACRRLPHASLRLVEAAPQPGGIPAGGGSGEAGSRGVDRHTASYTSLDIIEHRAEGAEALTAIRVLDRVVVLMSCGTADVDGADHDAAFGGEAAEGTVHGDGEGGGGTAGSVSSLAAERAWYRSMRHKPRVPEPRLSLVAHGLQAEALLAALRHDSAATAPAPARARSAEDLVTAPATTTAAARSTAAADTTAAPSPATDTAAPGARLKLTWGAEPLREQDDASSLYNEVLRTAEVLAGGGGKAGAIERQAAARNREKAAKAAEKTKKKAASLASTAAAGNATSDEQPRQTAAVAGNKQMRNIAKKKLVAEREREETAGAAAAGSGDGGGTGLAQSCGRRLFGGFVRPRWAVAVQRQGWLDDSWGDADERHAAMAIDRGEGAGGAGGTASAALSYSAAKGLEREAMARMARLQAQKRNDRVKDKKKKSSN